MWREASVSPAPQRLRGPVRRLSGNVFPLPMQSGFIRQGGAREEEVEAFFREAGVTEAEPAEDGGIMNSLWNLLEAYGLGCTIELRAIPILQETVEVCEVFDINPYRLSSGGCLLMAADNGFSALNALRKRGVEGAVIGKVEKGIARRILNGETETFLDRPKPDEIEKILNQREVKV